MKILTGVYQPDTGRILIAGKPVRLQDFADANRKGIGMVFQEQSLLTNLTVGENIYLGNEAQFTRLGIVDWKRLYAAAARQLAKVKLDVDPRTRADELDFAARQMVEIAKALTLEEAAGGHLVILLDEPTSVLERAEIDVLFARVRALRERASFIFVSHRLDEVLELSDRIYVMKDGAVVAELAAAEADVAKLHHWMVGRSLQAEYYREPLQKPFAPEVLVEAKGLVARPAPTGTSSFTLHAGEILGIAGVIGSGREELTRTLAGFAPHDGGTLARRRPRRCASPRRPRRWTRGMGYIPRERRVEGLVLFLPVAANITLADLAQPDAVRDHRHARRERALAERLGRAAAHPHARHPHALPQPLGRQPAEGGAGQVAGGEGADPDPRPPDARPRRRRQGGGLRAGPRGHRRGRRRDPDLRHAGGDDRALATRSSSCATARSPTAPRRARAPSRARST